MAMYWKVTITDSEKTVSYNPKTRRYRAPCDASHVALLKTAFTNYRHFVENLKKKVPATEKERALQAQLDRIDAYMRVLSSPGKDCIDLKETKPKVVSTDSGTLWHSVLPKIFKILYEKSKKGQKEVSIQEIRDEYDYLNEEVSQILEGIAADGPFKTDHDGMVATAESVVELFNLLEHLFPDIFKKVTGKGTPEGPKITEEEALASFDSALDYLDPTVKKCIRSAIKSAVVNYNKKDYKAFWADIARAMECFKKVIDALKAEIGGVKKKLGDADEEIKRLTGEIEKLEEEIRNANENITTSLKKDIMAEIPVEDERKKVADRIQATINAYRKEINKLKTDGDSAKDAAFTKLLHRIHMAGVSTDPLDKIEEEMEDIRKDPLYSAYAKGLKGTRDEGKIKTTGDILTGLKKRTIQMSVQSIISEIVSSSDIDTFNASELKLINYFGGENTKHISDTLIKSTNDTVQSLKAAMLYKKTLEEISGAIGNKDALEKIKASLPTNKLTELGRVAPIESIVDELIKSVKCEEGSVEFKRIVGEIAVDSSDANLVKINSTLDALSTLTQDEKDTLKKLIEMIRHIHASCKVYTEIIRLMSETIKKPVRDWSATTDAVGKLDNKDPVKPELETIVKFLSSKDAYNSLIGELLQATTQHDVPAALNLFKAKVTGVENLDKSEKDNLIEISDFIISIFGYKTRHEAMKNAIVAITELFKTPIPEPPAGSKIDEHITTYFTGKFNFILNDVNNGEDKSALDSMMKAIMPNSTNCGPFIKAEVLSAKKALYKQMVQHMQRMMNSMAEYVTNLQNLLDPANLNNLLEAKMSDDYDDKIVDITKQLGIQTFDIGINRLIDYLKVLDSNYEQWICCICKEGETWSPKKGICCPEGQSVDPATGECRAHECTGGKVLQSGACVCPTQLFDGEDATGKCVKCESPSKWSISQRKCIIDKLPKQQNFNDHDLSYIYAHLNHVIFRYRKLGTHVYPDAKYKSTGDEEDTIVKNLAADIMEGESQRSFSSIIDFELTTPGRYPYKLEENTKTFIEYMKGIFNRIKDDPKTFINRNRRLIISLFKIAYRYIKKFICKSDDILAAEYVDAIYNLLNTEKLIETVFKINGVDINILERIKMLFYTHVTYDSPDPEFWNPRLGTADYDQERPKHFYSINWRSINSVNFFIDKMKGEIDSVEPPKAGGARTDLSFGPDDIPKVLAQQVAWEEMNKQYNSLEPEYQQMLPEPEPAPIHSLTEPIHRFIDDFADEDPLEEARESVGLLAPHEVDDLMANDNGIMDRIKPLYKNALPSAKDEWIPILVRADTLRTLL
jgi:archaellum component FlaC